ncbi:MAG: thiamine pyrophosphate-dependent enzyme [Candidatus Odinarchaeia archaeon]
MAIKPKELAKEPDLLLSGHRLCPGCGEGTIVRLILKASEGPIIAANATGCLEVTTSTYPYSSWAIPWIHSAFENAAATASGIAAALKSFERRGKLKYKKVNVIAFAGDGGTFDIGFQALSGALERGDNITYVLLDNEAYMNTGIQRSGGTQKYAATTTSPAGKVIPGKIQWKKPLAHIVAEHRIPYVATVAPAYWMDLMQKARKAFNADGPAFIHAFATCPRGWRSLSNMSITITQLAVETCIFPLWEAELVDGEPVYKLSPPSKAILNKPERKKPVEEYLKLQGRFKHLFKPEPKKELIEDIQRHVDKEWEILLKKCGEL